MSQTGYTPIQLYHTSTPATVPSAGNLTDGELAINIADGKLYYKNSSGVVTLLASAAGALGTVTSVGVSGGTTGLTASGSPVTTSGTITLGGTLAVTNGGTGVTTIPPYHLIVGNGTLPVQNISPGATGEVLTSNGTNWYSASLPSAPVTSVNGQTGAVVTTGLYDIGSIIQAYFYTSSSTVAPGVTFSGASGLYTGFGALPGYAIVNNAIYNLSSNLYYGVVTSLSGMLGPLSLSGTWRLLTRIENTTGGGAYFLSTLVRIS